MKTIISSPSEERFIAALNKFYYTSTISVDFETGEVSNSLGVITSVIAKKVKGRYRLLEK